ncbi:MAG: 3',5'-cyclic-nucleotide phosphodiesterase [Gammaproteobacteria bacterium]|nr:3',5'-cyclic-nucleotide phosphodiesterase [Gammaproteobacteria bacterium]
MRIKVLGCSGGVGPGLRTTSLLVDEEILIDAGTGIGDLSLAQMQRIGHIFLTHSHLDHVCGLAFIADNLFDLIDRPVRILATAETLDAIRTHIFNWKIWPDFSKLPNERNPLIVFEEIRPGQPVAISDFRITPFPVLHTVPAVGYSLESAAGTFAFSGDTYAADELWNALNALKRLDRLMIEIAFADDDEELGRVSRHFTPALLGRELKKLKHRPKLLLTHHKPGCEAVIEKECRTALKGWDYRHLSRGDIVGP